MLAWLWTRLSEDGPETTISGRALKRFAEREVERLLRARVLVEHRKADNWSVCAHCDCGLDARPIRLVGGQLRACCPYDPAEDVLLDESDILRFTLDPDKLAEIISAAGSLSGKTSRLVDGLWFLGEAPAGIAVSLCSDHGVLGSPGTLLALKAASGQIPVRVIICDPDQALILRLCTAGIELSPISEMLIPGPDGRERLVIEPAPTAKTAIRLVVRRSIQAAILDGRALSIPTQPFVLLHMLAEQVSLHDPVVLNQTIERELGRAPREIIRDLRLALVANGLTKAQAEALIKLARNRGYTLGLYADEVALEN